MSWMRICRQMTFEMPRFAYYLCRAAPVALLLGACSPQSAAETPAAPVAAESGVHPVSGLEVAPLTVTTSDGTTHDFRVEMAITGQDQQRGLMFRTEMGANEGMLFPRDAPRMASFWMRNTVLSLDIIFIDEDHRIINIADHATPYSEDPIPSAAPALAILELNAGRAGELGIAAGDLVEW